MCKRIDEMGKTFEQCVDMAMENIYHERDVRKDLGMGFPLNIESCRWACEQAIINRPEGYTMLQASLEYAENICINTPEYI